MDESCSIWLIDELKGVFATLLFHFPWRRARSMIFYGKLEQTLTLPTAQTVSLWLVWLLRKKTAKVPPLIPEESVFWSMVWKIFSIVYFDSSNHLCMLVLPFFNLVCAFAFVFSEKSAFMSAKVAKTSFLAFLSVFIGTSTSALCISHSTRKNGWKVAQIPQSSAT